MPDQNIVEKVKAELERRDKREALALADREEETVVEMARLKQNYEWLDATLERGAIDDLPEDEVGWIENTVEKIDEKYWDDEIDEWNISAIYNDIIEGRLDEEDRDFFRDHQNRIEDMRPKALDAIEENPDTEYVTPSEPEDGSRLNPLWELLSYVTGFESKDSLFGTFSNSEKGKPYSIGQKAAWQLTTDDDPNRGGDKPIAKREGYDMTRRGFVQTAGATIAGVLAADPEIPSLGSSDNGTGTPNGDEGTPTPGGDSEAHEFSVNSEEIESVVEQYSDSELSKLHIKREYEEFFDSDGTKDIVEAEVVYDESKNSMDSIIRWKFENNGEEVYSNPINIDDEFAQDLYEVTQ